MYTTRTVIPFPILSPTYKKFAVDTCNTGALLLWDVFEIETNQAFDVVVLCLKSHAPLVPKWTKPTCTLYNNHYDNKPGYKKSNMYKGKQKTTR